MRVMGKKDPLATRTVVVKHHALVRLAHWATVPVLLGLIASGLSIYWASPVHEHAPNPATGSTDYLADFGVWISHRLPGNVADPAAWVYDRFGLGTFRLAQALRLHWLFAYLFMAVGLLYVIGLATGGGYKALLPRRGAQLTLVYGRSDEYLTPKVASGIVARFRQRGIPHEEMAFDGGHELNEAVLRDLAR